MDKFLINKIQDILNHPEHNLIIGVDFDNTIFPLDESQFVVNRCKEVLEELKMLQCNYGSRIKLCLYTVADDSSLKYKLALCELNGLKIDYVNESPIKMGNGQKPFFNLLLDDKAGLNETLEILKYINEL